MQCVICERPLLKPFKTIETKGDPLHFGRACAIKKGIWSPKPRSRAQVQHAAGEADPRQLAFDMGTEGEKL